jgi:peptidoglycan/LPS O-acetylase OafA/YrhL
LNLGTSDFLNASRWTAAFFVVLGHVFNISIAHYYDIPDRNLVLRGLHFFCGFAHMAVIVFFVISGFLVGGRAIERFLSQGFNATDYFLHRFSRIYTVFIPALVIGYMLDWSGIRFFNSSGIYTHPDQFYTNPLGNDITNHLSVEIFVGNVMQLQTIIVSSLGSNGPLWSLANEWWYYVLFGLCMIAYRSGRVLTWVVAGGAILAMLMVLPLTISLWFVMWGLGAGLAVLDRYWVGWSFFAGATIGFVCLIAVRWLDARLTDTGVATDFAMDFAVALGYSAALVCAKNLKERVKWWPLHRALASFSYTVYLVHFPAMVFAAAVLKEIFGIGFLSQPEGTVNAMIYLGALLIILYGYAWIFAAFTESYTDAVRSRLGLVISTLRQQANFVINKKVFEQANTVAAVLANDSVPRTALAVNQSMEASISGPNPS